MSESHSVRGLAVGAVLLATTAGFAGRAGSGATPAGPAPRAHNVVVEWNRTLLDLVQQPGAQSPTIHPTRDFAMMSLAVERAAGDPRLSDRPALQNAAAAQAAHDALVPVFRAERSRLDRQLGRDLAITSPGPSRAAARRVGARAAARVLRVRGKDGSAVPPPGYRTTGAPGDYRPTPPDFATPVFTQWGSVQPFVLQKADQFRPSAPPALDSPAYADALNEVKRLGRNTSNTRTTERTTIAEFWSAPIQNYWNAIADELLTSRHSSIRASARTLALVDLTLADAAIAMYDAKYHFRRWRPVTAIRHAGRDANPRTTGDPTWAPLSVTPADPSYPGAHSTISAAAATVLDAVFGRSTAFTVHSPALPGVVRSFDSFRQAAVEAGLSRIYAGVHTRLDHRAGLRLGTRIARYTLTHALSRSHDLSATAASSSAPPTARAWISSARSGTRSMPPGSR